ncbi:hypothetical protein [Acidithiobacillus thiooxidans]|uniref:hypothetical protein n=1 Tax=Acidithiobacillus thiooxidans TaxID=930 RepID=UPI0004E24E4C|nr:hypothetical protein [Acidithiobacillus thiooxidans]
MHVEATINGKDFKLNLTPGKQSENHAAIKAAVESTGISWLESEILVVNFPERGRGLNKQSGYQSLGASG